MWGAHRDDGGLDIFTTNNCVITIVVEVYTGRESMTIKNWTLWVYAKLGFLEKSKNDCCLQNSFPYSADVKPTLK